MPVTQWMVVDLPAPLGPRNPKNSPSGMVSDKSSPATVPRRYTLRRLEIFRAGTDMPTLYGTNLPNSNPIYLRPPGLRNLTVARRSVGWPPTSPLNHNLNNHGVLPAARPMYAVAARSR